MTPQVEKSQYHDHKPLLHDLQYHMVNGVPTMDDADSVNQDIHPSYLGMQFRSG